jgi:hypothetical protein
MREEWVARSPSWETAADSGGCDGGGEGDRVRIGAKKSVTLVERNPKFGVGLAGQQPTMLHCLPRDLIPSIGTSACKLITPDNSVGVNYTD